MRKMETHTMVQIVLLIAGLYALLNRRHLAEMIVLDQKRLFGGEYDERFVEYALAVCGLIIVASTAFSLVRSVLG